MNSTELRVLVPPPETQQGLAKAWSEESSFKHSEASQGQRPGGEPGRSHASASCTQEPAPSNKEGHLIMEVLRSPANLWRQAKEQFKRPGGVPLSPMASEHAPEVGNTTAPDDRQRQPPRAVKWRFMLGMIRRKIQREKHKDKRYNYEVRIKGYSSASNTVVVVSALIATLSFAALLQPPGGIDNVGTANLMDKRCFMIFYVTNGMALLVALLTILILTSVVPRSYNGARLLYYQGKVLVWVATMFTVIAFSSAAYIVAGDRHRNLAWIMIGAAGSTIFVLFAVLVHVSVKRSLKKEQEEFEKRKKKGAGSVQR